MKVVKKLAVLGKRAAGPVFLAVGFFDGFHRGHQAVVGRCVATARRSSGGAAWVLTFDKHPLRVLAPGHAPPLLTATAHKLKLLKNAGLDGCVVLPFSRSLAGEEPEAFVRRVAGTVPNLKRFFVGSNWTFGRAARGTPALLRREAARYGVATTTVHPLTWRGKPISSTRIRQALRAGQLREASRMLGRTVSVMGRVVPGKRIGGARVGFPTANLYPHSEVWPPFGVYAAYADVKGQTLKAVVNVGLCPTVSRRGRAAPSMEVHLLDFRERLYGTMLEVFFVGKLRDECAFDSVTALRAQIQRDIRDATRMLESTPRP